MDNRLINITKRLKTNPGYKYSLFEKLIRTAISIVINILLFPFRYLTYGQIFISSWIDISASLRNLKNIHIEKKVIINKGVVLWAGIEKGIFVGQSTQINPYTAVYGDVKIGKNVMIAPHVMLAGGGHGFKDLTVPMIFQASESKGGIEISDDVWIGANSTILDGVKIGKGAIIAAGSAVVNNVESYSIVAGVPAREIKSRLSN